MIDVGILIGHKNLVSPIEHSERSLFLKIHSGYKDLNGEKEFKRHHQAQQPGLIGWELNVSRFGKWNIHGKSEIYFSLVIHGTKCYKGNWLHWRIQLSVLA